MNYIEILGLLFIFFFFINKILVSKKLFIDPKHNSYHKSFLDNSGDVPFSGGILILTSCLFFLPFKTPFLIFFILSLFLVGILSDLEIIKSPSKRIFLQIFIVLAYLIISENLVPYTRIEFLDVFFENYYVRIFFTLFCILVLINGSNFIDGINTLVATYYIMILGCFIYLKYNFYLDYEIILHEVILLTLIVFLVFNFFGKAYLGDNGAYLISFIVGIISIDLVNKYITISPYFIVCLLWYPAYENLFSIIRKIFQNFSPSKPDNKHLHQLLFRFLKKKFKLNSRYTNTITGISINFYNFFVFMFAVSYHWETEILTAILIFNALMYSSIYFVLNKTKK